MLPCMSFCFVRCLSLLHTRVCRSKVICFEINSDASGTTLMLLLCFVVFHNTGANGKHKTCASKAPGHVPSQRLVRLHLFREWRIFQGTGEGSWLVMQARSRCFFPLQHENDADSGIFTQFSIIFFSATFDKHGGVQCNMFPMESFWRCCICPGSVGPVGTQEAARVSRVVGQVPIYGPINW